jgi:hypothetical protein
MAPMYSGHRRKALESLAAAMRLDRSIPTSCRTWRRRRISAWARRNRRRPSGRAHRAQSQHRCQPHAPAASYGHLGRIDEAREAWTGLLEVNPGFSIQQREGVLPYKDARDFQRILDGLAKAGLP